MIDKIPFIICILIFGPASEFLEIFTQNPDIHAIFGYTCGILTMFIVDIME